MKLIMVILVCAFALSVAGCEKKTGLEKMQADMNKAGSQMNKDLQSMTK